MQLKLALRFIAVVSALLTASCALDSSRESASIDSTVESTNKLFAVEVRVGPNWDNSLAPNEQEFFSEHSANLKRLREAGHIAMGARYSDVGLIVFSAQSADEVRAFMSSDPSMSAGTFKYDVYQMNVFYPGMVQP
ncbi:MAG: hypothetical protein HKM98_11200 [Gammaproteobacteria bacterium]|nr:hypothetical protein [Gammaproteobacteria bacterium]